MAVKSYTVRLENKYINALTETIDYYRQAVSFLMEIANQEWKFLWSFSGKKQKNELEKMIHSSRSRKAKYSGFDQKFYKMPSYFRRAAMSTALGNISSYHSKWENEGIKPHFNRHPRSYPCLYKGNCFRLNEDGTCSLKLRVHHDWSWVDFHLRQTDVDYLSRKILLEDCDPPVLIRKGKHFYLRFSFSSKDPKLPEKVRKICAVDLGMNNDAVCSILDDRGTVLARRFIHSPCEKDCLYSILDQISTAQSRGSKYPRKLWRFAKNYNHQISMRTATEIIRFAGEYEADCIVMEHLSFEGKIRGSKKYRLKNWRYREIQNVVVRLAHANGMRFSTVLARGTSQYAFDGSGKVKRDSSNHAVAYFQNGKIYNADLSASYNIGARYFIRNRLKEAKTSEDEDYYRSLQAKDPGAGQRTLSTLRELIAFGAERTDRSVFSESKVCLRA